MKSIRAIPRAIVASAVLSGLVLFGTVTTSVAQVSPLDHYTLFNAAGPSPSPIMPSIQDQFLTLPEVPLGPVVAFLPPATKTIDGVGEPMINPIAHLTCYAMPQMSFSESVTVSNQFGEDQPLQIGAPRYFCVPSYKDFFEMLPLNLDHFLCYDAIGPAPTPPAGPILVQDQFKPSPVEVMDIGAPTVFCNPARKNEEPTINLTDHLTCYGIPFQPGAGQHFVFNQFHEANVDVQPNTHLCLPSTKQLVPPTSTSTTTTTTTSTTLVTPSVCGQAPAVGCRTGATGKSGIQMTLAGGARDKLTWKFKKGGATAAADFLTPDVSVATTLHVCAYDASATAQPLLEAAIPSDGTCAGAACWKVLGTKGFGYKDKGLTPDGVATAKLLAGAPGKSRVLVKGKGINLPMPTLPLTFPLTVQLIVTDGITTNCWQNVFSTSIKNDASSLKAVGP